MTSKKWVWKSFAVDDLRQEVVNESSLQQLLANFIAFPAENAPESNPRTLEAWLVARYGLLATVEMLSFTRSAMSLPVNEQQRLLATFHPHLDAKHFHVLHRVASTSPAVLKSCQTSVLTLPTSSCLLCPNSPHLSVHHQCNVVVYGFGRARQATKISTRCQCCCNIYNYTSFGNAGDGWTLYQEARDLVEASDACFMLQQTESIGQQERERLGNVLKRQHEINTFTLKESIHTFCRQASPADLIALVQFSTGSKCYSKNSTELKNVGRFVQLRAISECCGLCCSVGQSDLRSPYSNADPDLNGL